MWELVTALASERVRLLPPEPAVMRDDDLMAGLRLIAKTNPIIPAGST